MQNFIMLNDAAVENLLDGQLPRYATVEAPESGIRIKPRKNRTKDAAELIDGLIPTTVPAAMLETPLGVRMVEDGSLFVFGLSSRRAKNFPNAKIIQRAEIKLPVASKPMPRQSEDRAAREDETSYHPFDDGRKSFLIRRDEIVSNPIAVKPKPIERVEETIDEMATRVAQQWTNARHAAHSEMVHFASNEAHEVAVLDAAPVRRLTEKVIMVPMSFDRRRASGLRQVEVTVKRRRSFH